MLTSKGSIATYRDDVSGQHSFEDLDHVRQLSGKFIWEYNNIRPHDSLQNLTPRSFLLKYGRLPATQIDAEYPTFQQDGNNQKSLLLNVATQGEADA